MWMAHKNNGYLVPFLDCSIDRENAARICAQISVRRMVLLVLSFRHLQQGAVHDDELASTYMEPSLPQPLRRVSVHSQYHGKPLHEMFSGKKGIVQLHSNFEMLFTSVHMNVCASAVAAVNQAISDAVRHRSSVLCLPSAACFCPRPFLYKAGACVSADSQLAGLFDCGGNECILHSRLVCGPFNSENMTRDRFARAYAAQLTPFRFFREPRHILDIGCGSGCWSLLLAGPSLHVTVLVFDQTLAKAAIEMVKKRGNQEFVHIVLADAGASTLGATELLLPLTTTSPLNRVDFFGFEFLVLLDVLQSLSFSAVQDLSSAIKPFMHARSKALVSVWGIAEIKKRSGEWYEPDKLEAAMSDMHASVLWCGIVSREPEIKEFGCERCSLIELLLVGTRKAPPEPPRYWHMSDFVPICNQRSGRACGGNNNVQELILRQELMRMNSLEDHEMFDSFQAWAKVKPGPEKANYRADFDGRLLVLPNFLQAVDIHDPKQIVLCLHMDASRINFLDIIARSWNGPVSVAIVVYHNSFHSVIDLVLQARKSNEAVRRWCSIHLVRFAHSPEHYAVNSFRNVAVLFASSLWVLCIDADFVPMNGTRIVLQRAVESRGHGPNGEQLKRAFVVSVLASRDVFTEPIDFAMIDYNLGDDLDHKFHSFPLPNGVEEKSGRSHQSHGGSDLQKWRESTRNNSGMFQIAFSHSMEPYYVMPMHSWATVMYDERFRRWGGDKQSHAHELASASYQFFVVPGAAIVHQPHAVAQYAWSIDKNIVYNCDIVGLVFAKEDSLLFPSEYMTAADGSCSKHLQYAQGQISKVSVATYHDRIDFYYGQIQRCRDAFAPYYLQLPLPSATSEEQPGFSCTSVVQCH
jgi:glycosyltransferase involved in cell wall biosynthesis/SAM-dependent methyltransferase